MGRGAVTGRDKLEEMAVSDLDRSLMGLLSGRRCRDLILLKRQPRAGNGDPNGGGGAAGFRGRAMDGRGRGKIGKEDLGYPEKTGKEAGKRREGKDRKDQTQSFCSPGDPCRGTG